MAESVGADVKLDIKFPSGNRLWVKGSLGLKEGIMLDDLHRLTSLDVHSSDKRGTGHVLSLAPISGRTWDLCCSWTTAKPAR